MRITNLHIDRFGAWTGLDLNHLTPGITVLFGPNEAGKTTLLQFLKSMFYGYDGEEMARYLEPPDLPLDGATHADARLGGRLTLVSGGREFELRRTRELLDSGDTQGNVRLTTPDGDRLGSHRLQTLLAGTDATIFQHVFAVGLKELQQLATLDETEAAGQLYALSTGPDRVSLVEVIRHLQDAQRQWVGGPGAFDDSTLARLVTRRRRLRELVADEVRRRDQWVQLTVQQRELNEEQQRFEDNLQELKRSARLTEAVQTSMTPWKRRQAILDELRSLGSPRKVAEETLRQLEQCERELSQRQTQLRQYEDQEEELLKRREQLDLAAPPLRGLGRIDSIWEQRASLQQLSEQRAACQRRLEEIELELMAEHEAMGFRPAGKTHEKGGMGLDLSQFRLLIEPARQLDRQNELLEDARQSRTRHQESLKRIESDVRSALDKEPDLFDREDAADLVEAVKKTGVAAGKLREQVTVARQIQRLQSELQRLDSSEADHWRNQLLPWDVTLGVGVVFSLGAFLLLLAFFGDWFALLRSTRQVIALIGVVFGLAAAALKHVLEWTTRRGASETRTAATGLEQKLRTAQRRLESLRQSTPRKRSGPLGVEDAESRLSHLESLMPLESRRRSARQTAWQGEQQVNHLADQLESMTLAWQDALRQLGLPPDLTTEQVRKLVGDSGTLSTLRRQQAAAMTEAMELDRDWEAWQRRLTAALEDATPAGVREQDPLKQMAHLGQRREQDHAHKVQREEWAGQRRKIREAMSPLASEIRTGQARCDRLLREAGSADIEALRARYDAWSQVCRLKEQLSEAERDLDAARGEFERELIEQQLVGETAENRAARSRSVPSELERCQSRLQEIAGKQGALAEKIRTLATDPTAAQRRLEEARIQQQLQEAMEQWQIVAALSLLLQSVHQKYEREHQPETLRDATEFFRTISSGRYTRVWTPLAEDILLVDTADGRTLPIPQLSSGTREQLYLCLRLALVAGCARRGVQMPMILDDVFVNFDVERTGAAADLLLTFSQQGHQVVVLTCHEHVRDIFRKLQVDVRSLPGRSSDAPGPEITDSPDIPRAAGRDAPPQPRARTTPVLGWLDPSLTVSAAVNRSEVHCVTTP